ncbi:fosmidomycin resistance protein [Halobacteriales archaeon QS_4_70_19]|nr:MAG: fosmidomycin resistance protein [Halobacteriales archaeon QS_4_70_19]
MLSGLAWLALEVKSLDRAVAFYQDHLDLSLRRQDGREAALGAGETDLLLRRPAGVPRGGLHTHYAFSCPADAYDDWWDRLAANFGLHEETFGDVRSLYFYDTEGNCVEVMGRDSGSQTAITGLSRRTRLTAGPFDLELWEPHLGLADARGGVHVDLGAYVDDPEAAADAVWGRADRVEDLDGGDVRVRDPDGHYLTFVGE